MLEKEGKKKNTTDFLCQSARVNSAAEIAFIWQAGYSPRALHQDTAALSQGDPEGEPRPAHTAYTGAFQSGVKGLARRGEARRCGGIVASVSLFSPVAAHSKTESVRRAVLIMFHFSCRSILSWSKRSIDCMHHTPDLLQSHAALHEDSFNSMMKQ